MMVNVRNRVRMENIEKNENKKIIKQQSKLTFNGIHESFEYCDSFSFKQIELKMDNPIHVGFVLLELSKLHLYET